MTDEPTICAKCKWVEGTTRILPVSEILIGVDHEKWFCRPKGAPPHPQLGTTFSHCVERNPFGDCVYYVPKETP